MARFWFFVFFLMLFAVGCGETVEEKAMEKRIEDATGAEAEVDLSNKGMKVTGETEEGKFTVSTGESIEIPKDFPTDVLIYNPSKVVMAMKLPGGHSLSLTTGNDMTEVSKVYQQEMKAKGWSEETSMNMGNQSVLIYKQENRIANITITKTDTETRITVTVATDQTG